MERNRTINLIFLMLCVLLMGFVYLNNKMAEAASKGKAEVEVVNDKTR